MSTGRDSDARPWWREDLPVFVLVFVSILIASQLANGTTRPEIMLGTAVVLALLVRLTRLTWRRVTDGRDHRR